MSTVEPEKHVYLSTACLHGEHEYCQGAVTREGEEKIPGKCKFCDSKCCCVCHWSD